MGFATQTSTDVANRALAKVGAIAAGGTPSAADSNIAIYALQSIYDDLRARGKAPFPFDEIPAWAHTPLTAMLAYAIATDYGVTPDRYTELERGDASARQTIDTNTASMAPQVPVRIKDY
jgi:hypothetical protein